jgi:dTDP-glucose 4,6-dehydratase
MDKKNYICTGGFGFICSVLINTLLKQGHKIICIDKLSYASNLDYIEDKDNPNFLFWHEDLINIHHYWDELKDLKVDGIFHLAAESHVDNSIANPYPFIDSNVKGTLNVLELTKLLNTKLVACSTDETLGSINEGFAIESDTLHTNSVYSASKAAGELLCQAYFSTHKLNVCVTRCGNNLGPHQHHEKFCPKVILNALQDKEIPVYGDGKNIRQWTYVQNHVEDLINVMNNGKAGQIYHVGGGEHFTNNEIVNIILEKLGKPKSLIKMVPDRLDTIFAMLLK